jgi:hypothetical protein
MSFPEWAQSYNALYVPLASDWQCSLVPARDVQHVDRTWDVSYDERQKAIKSREQLIEQDRRDFDRLFRVSINRDDARTSDDFRTYAAFIREHLSISGMGTPIDGEDVTRILREAVRDGWLVPAIHRAWRGSSRVSRPYAPQSWPKRAPDPKPTVYGVRDGQFVPLDADGFFIERAPYVPVASVSGATRSSSGADWLGVVEAAAGAVLGGTGTLGVADSFMDGGESTPLGDAQAFDYRPDTPDGDSFGIAKTPNEGEPGTWYTNPGSGQMRMYGNDGQPVVDFDFGHDHGQGTPHAHNWDGGVRGPGVAFSPF